MGQRTANVTWHTMASRDQREQALGQRGGTVWFTGLPSSGKSTLAAAVEERLLADGRAAYLLDGDNLRHGLNGDLGFSATDRSENVRRVGHVAHLMADAGLIVLVSLVSPYESDRRRVRELHETDGLAFTEVWVNTTADECARRDPKGLWKRARAGEVTGFTGVDDPYENPTSPEIEVTPDMALESVVEAVLEAATRRRS